MKIVTPSVEIMRTGLETTPIIPEQFIEKVGRTCYKSEDKITPDSAVKFVGNLVKRGHEAMIEHWSLVFKTDGSFYSTIRGDYNVLLYSGDMKTEDRVRPYIRFTDTHVNDKQRFVISGNMRAWRDFVKGCMAGFNYIPSYLQALIRDYPTFFPEFQDKVTADKFDDILRPISMFDLTEVERRIHQDVTMKFVCDRGVSHEMVRHRVASFAQESTRYCNYSGDKFGGEITVVRPSWCGEGTNIYEVWKEGCLKAEAAYFDLLAASGVPQEARSVLPNSTKTEIIVTMNLDGWDHFFGLRDAAAAQPDMREVAAMAHCMYDKQVLGR